MEYFRILNLKREPFSSAPDPEFFHESPQYLDCLQQLEIALRLRRGLDIVTGDAGTGKTVLCCHLIRRLSWDKGLVIRLLPDPAADTPEAFLLRIAGVLGILPAGEGEPSQERLKEAIRNHLLEQSLERGKIVVLCIDEGQNLPEFGLEILREFLNYETNGCKLLQVVIFSRREFLKTMKAHRGFAGRINLLFHLKPLSFGDAKSMILFRIERAADEGASPIRFTLPALWEIHRASSGYPGRIVALCHRILLMLIVQTREGVDRSLVRETLRKSGSLRSRAGYAAVAGGLAGLLLAFLLLQSGPVPVREVKDSSRAASVGGPISAGEEEVFPIRTNPEWTARLDPPGTTGGREGKAAALSAAAPAAGLPACPSCPATLGRLTMRRGDVIWKLMADVYGISTSRHLKILEEANPQIRDMGRIALGDVLCFPAVPTTLAPRPRLFWMALAESGDLEEIYGLYRLYPRDLPQVRVVSWWNRSGGLRFALVLRKPFEGEEAAWQAVNVIPESFAQSARVLSGWEEGTVFFSAFGAS